MRESVAEMLSSIFLFKSLDFEFVTPSLMRSNTIIVSFSEYPKIVSKAARVSRFTSRRKNEITPSAIIISCACEIIAAMPKRHSKRKATYIKISTIETLNAIMPFCLSSAPTFGPTTSTRRTSNEPVFFNKLPTNKAGSELTSSLVFV